MNPMKFGDQDIARRKIRQIISRYVKRTLFAMLFAVIGLTLQMILPIWLSRRHLRDLYLL